jgi:hypothetical protein
MSQTAKNIVDSIIIILTKFSVTKDSRFDEDWLFYKINQVASEMKVKQYMNLKYIDYTWLSLPITLNFYRVNGSDDVSVNCKCDVSKSQIPQTISLPSMDGNLDLGVFSLNSMCGTKTYTLNRITQWSYIPQESTFSLFPYYDRKGTYIYVNSLVDKLKFTGILLDPTEGYIINSTPVLSGALVNGTVYAVKYGTIVYNKIPYAANSTFTAGSDLTFVGSGLVYLNSQLRAFRDVDPYPASGEMIRQIELEILTKEFGLEARQVNDVRNDSVDDANK